MSQPPDAQTIFITAYDDQEALQVADGLRRLHRLSAGQHRLVDDPAAATLIMVGGIGNEMPQKAYILRTLRCGVISRFPNKCFTFSYRDTPVAFNRGIYESAVVSAWTRNRCAGGAYALSGHWNDKVVPAPTGQRDLLCSFMGRMSHDCRRRLRSLEFTRPDVLIEDSSEFNYWAAAATERDARERRFATVLMRSKFCLCPRGIGTGSIRLFEAMRAGVAPVIISDDWVRPACLDWERFAIFVKERELPGLEAALVEREADHASLGQAARAAWDEQFADECHFDHLVAACARIRRDQRTAEAVYWNLRYPLASTIFANQKLRHLGKAVSARALAASRRMRVAG